MTEIAGVGLTVFGSLLASYALLYIGTAVIAPRAFLDNLSLNDARFKRLSESAASPPTYHWTYYAWVSALAVGLAIILYHLVGSLTMWIPESWQSNQDGSEALSIKVVSQAIITFFLWAVVATSILDKDANAHQLVKPTGWHLSSWARRGYENADEAIRIDAEARRPEMKSGYSSMEFLKGYDLRLAEEGDSDALSGVYRPTKFANSLSYTDAWITAATRLQTGGWRHENVSERLKAIRAARAAEAAAEKKAYWKAALGFDPDEALQEPPAGE